MLFPPQQTVRTVDKGHGRIETRTLTATDILAGYVELPHAQAVFRVTRHTTNLQGQLIGNEVVYGVSSLSAVRHGPTALLHFVRGHWAIENKVHYVRDVTFDEDRSRIRKGNGPQVMATLRNLALSLLRLAGASNIARATRYLTTRVKETLRLLGIP